MKGQKQILVASEIECIKQDQILFSNINFSLRAGEMLFIHGANGTGKTSLLRILAGLAFPSSGAIYWHEKLIEKQAAAYREQFMYLGHKNGVKNHLTVLENLQSIYLHKTIDFSEKINDVLLKFNLKQVLYKKAYGLSTGQKQRLALAKLLLADVKLWMLDEPLTAIDEEGVTHVQETIRNHLDKEGIVIVTSHQPLKIDHSEIQHIYL